MDVTLIDNSTALQALAPEWPAGRESAPFRRLQWLGPWWRSFGEGRGIGELMTLAVRDSDGTLVAVAPWYLNRSLAGGRAIRFLGTGMVCSDYLSIPCLGGREQQATAALADWLATADERWDVIELSSIDPDDKLVAELSRQLAAAGHRLHTSVGPNCWRLSLPESWEQYLLSLKKTHRHRTRQLWRRSFESGEATVERVDNEADWPAGFDTLRRLHQARRESLGERGCFAVPEFDRFANETGREFLRAGQAFLHILHIGGQPAAAEFNLLGGDTLYYYQTGLDPAKLSAQPGHLLTMARIHNAIERGLRTVDFLRGDEPYKATWNATPHALADLRIVRRRPSAALRHQMWLANRGARKLARRGLDAAEEMGRRVKTRRVAVLKSFGFCGAEGSTSPTSTVAE